MSMEPSTIKSSSWASSVKEALGGQFKPQMTRAVIFLAIFEANRILSNTNESWSTMRPFQRKISILHTALDLIYTLDFLSDDDKAHIISLTPKNKPNAKPIIARMAFNRAQGLEGEIENKIFPGIEKLIGGEKSHGDICDAFVQNLFEEVTGKSGVHPPLWVFHRRPIFLIYKVYYRGMNVDPDVFEAEALRAVELPKTRPACVSAYVFGTWSPMNSKVAASNDTMSDEDDENKTQEVRFVGDVMVEDNEQEHDKSREMNTINQMNHKQRLQYLMELKLRLDLLNEVGAGDDGGFVEEDMRAEKTKIFQSLQYVAPAPCKNRHLATMETKIRLDILKDLKKSNVCVNRCIKMMKDMYLTMPPLMNGEGVGSTFLHINNKRAQRMAKKAARMARREEIKKSGASQSIKTDGVFEKEATTEDEWEVLDEMEEVNDSVAGMDVGA